MRSGHTFRAIHGARGLSITDSEKVGFYDLNEISYSDRDKSVRITGGIPILIEVSVDGLKLELVPRVVG